MKYYKLKDSVDPGEYPEYKRNHLYGEYEIIGNSGLNIGDLARTYTNDWEEVEGPMEVDFEEGFDISFGFICRLCEKKVSVDGGPFLKRAPVIPICDYCLSKLADVVKGCTCTDDVIMESIDGGRKDDAKTTEYDVEDVREGFVHGTESGPLTGGGPLSVCSPSKAQEVNDILEKTARDKEQYDMGFRDGMKKAAESPLRIVVLKPLSKYYRKVLNKLMPVIHHSSSLEEMWKTVSDPSFMDTLSRDVTNGKNIMYIKFYEGGDDSIDFMSGYGYGLVFRVEKKKSTRSKD